MKCDTIVHDILPYKLTRSQLILLHVAKTKLTKKRKLRNKKRLI